MIDYLYLICPQCGLNREEEVFPNAAINCMCEGCTTLMYISNKSNKFNEDKKNERITTILL